MADDVVKVLHGVEVCNRTALLSHVVPAVGLPRPDPFAQALLGILRVGHDDNFLPSWVEEGVPHGHDLVECRSHGFQHGLVVGLLHATGEDEVDVVGGLWTKVDASGCNRVGVGGSVGSCNAVNLDHDGVHPRSPVRAWKGEVEETSVAIFGTVFDKLVGGKGRSAISSSSLWTERSAGGTVTRSVSLVGQQCSWDARHEDVRLTW